MSLPCASGVMPAATDDAAPPLEPPGVCVRDHGLYVRPRKSFTVSSRKLNAGVLVRPMMTAPAFFQLATTGLSAVAMRSLNAATPLTVAQPSWSIFSLMVTGTPCNGPNTSLDFTARATAASARSAAASASADKSQVTALSCGLTARIRAILALTASREEIARARIPCASATASHFQSSSVTFAPLDFAHACEYRIGHGIWNLFLGHRARYRLTSPAPTRFSATMAVIAVGGFQHETNTFAPSKDDYAGFQDGGACP